MQGGSPLRKKPSGGGLGDQGGDSSPVRRPGRPAGRRELSQIKVVPASIIKELDLSNSLIGDKGARALAQKLERDTTIENLLLCNNGIGPEGAKVIAEALEKNTTVIAVYLCDNRIGDEGVKSLAEALKKNTTITTLVLARNGVRDEGTTALAQALEENTSLLTIDLCYNGIGEKGARALVKAFEKNNTLTKLELHDVWKTKGWNPIPEDLLPIISHHLQENVQKRFNDKLKIVEEAIDTTSEISQEAKADLHNVVHEVQKENESRLQRQQTLGSQATAAPPTEEELLESMAEKLGVHSQIIDFLKKSLLKLSKNQKKAEEDRSKLEEDHEKLKKELQELKESITKNE